MIKYFKKLINSIRGNATNYKQLQFIREELWNEYKSPKVNLGQLQSNFNNLKPTIKSLKEVEFQVFSQFGDDGIIQWLINKIPLPFKTFIEFGVENYREANTRFLLINNYWSGLVIDGNKDNIDSVRKEQISNFYDLQSECSFITKSNINEIISSAKFHKDIGILSIDIDGNDYWIWSAIEKISPIIIITEYNCLFGFKDPYTIKYSDGFVRGKTTPFNFYGTSLRSAYELARTRGYSFIGSNSAGNNAYFIRDDYMKYLEIPKLTPEQGFVFASFSEAWDKDRIPLRGIEKLKSINAQKVINTLTMNEEIVDAEKIIQSLIQSGKIVRF